MIYAMFAMVLLTFVVGVIVLAVRVQSVRRGDVKIKYYRALNSQDVPEFITTSARCYNNMFEMPMLFYVACSLFVALSIESAVALVLAWVFVGFRVAQAIVHLTYNNVVHRMLMFWGGVFSVLALWLVLLLSLG